VNELMNKTQKFIDRAFSLSNNHDMKLCLRGQEYVVIART
jgi:hypothetical protein